MLAEWLAKEVRSRKGTPRFQEMRMLLKFQEMAAYVHGCLCHRSKGFVGECLEGRGEGTSS